MNDLKQILFSKKHDVLLSYLENNTHCINDIDENGWSALAYAVFWLEDSIATSILTSFNADLDESLARYLTLDSCRVEVISLYLQGTHIEFVCEKLIVNTLLTVEILSLMHQTYHLNISSYSQMIADYAFKQSDKKLLIYLLERKNDFDVHEVDAKLIHDIFIESDELFRETMFYILKERDFNNLYDYAIKNIDFVLFEFLLQHGVELYPNEKLFDFTFQANESLQKLILENASEAFITGILYETLKSKNVSFLRLLFISKIHLKCDDTDIVLLVFVESDEETRQKFLETNLLVFNDQAVKLLVDEAFSRKDQNLFYWVMKSSIPFTLSKTHYREFSKLVQCKTVGFNSYELTQDEWIDQLVSCQYIEKDFILTALLDAVPEPCAVLIIRYLLDNGVRFHKFSKQDKLQELFIVADYRAKIVDYIQDFHPILKQILDKHTLDLLDAMINAGVEINNQSLFDDLIKLSYDKNRFDLIENMYIGDEIKIYVQIKIKDMIADLLNSQYEKRLNEISELPSEIEEKEQFLAVNQDALDNWISVGDEEDDDHFLKLAWRKINELESELEKLRKQLEHSKNDLKAFEETLKKYVQFEQHFFRYIPQKLIDDLEKIFKNIGIAYDEAGFVTPDTLLGFEIDINEDEIPF